MKRSTELRQRDRGFTLLEVLAAVAILGIWFSVLASVAIQGQRAEGENERRIRASLLADEVLMELEIGIEELVFPDETDEEFESDEFLVHIETQLLAEMGLGEADAALQAILEGDLSEIALDIHAILITVSWSEGHGERTVERLSYYFDSTRLSEILENLSDPNSRAALEAGAREAGTGL